VIFKTEPKIEEQIEEKKSMPGKTEKSGPKIQILAEETNFDSMVVEKNVGDKLVEISIEIDSVETMKELDLEISNKDIKLYKAGPERYTSLI
jgi:adenylyl- and sulfurtransferase ThiI